MAKGVNAGHERPLKGVTNIRSHVDDTIRVCVGTNRLEPAESAEARGQLSNGYRS